MNFSTSQKIPENKGAGAKGPAPLFSGFSKLFRELLILEGERTVCPPVFDCPSTRQRGCVDCRPFDYCGDSQQLCACAPAVVRKYPKPISVPWRDRIDVPHVDADDEVVLPAHRAVLRACRWPVVWAVTTALQSPGRGYAWLQALF